MVWECKTWFPFNSNFISKKLLERIIQYPGKNYPDPDWTEILTLDQTQPKNILKNVLQSQTSFGLVRSRTGET